MVELVSIQRISCKKLVCFGRVNMSQRMAIISFLGLAVLPAVAMAGSWVSQPLIALNTSLNELFGNAFAPTNVKDVGAFIVMVQSDSSGCFKYLDLPV